MSKELANIDRGMIAQNPEILPPVKSAPGTEIKKIASAETAQKEVRYLSPVPKLGDEIYVPGSNLGYVGQGEYVDAVLGGRAKVSQIVYAEKNGVREAYVGVEEHPHHLYSWLLLSILQENLSVNSERGKARRDPDSWNLEGVVESFEAQNQAKPQRKKTLPNKK